LNELPQNLAFSMQIDSPVVVVVVVEAVMVEAVMVEVVVVVCF